MIDSHHVTICQNEMRCGHCGAREIIPMPSPFEDALNAMRRFGRRHAHCRIDAIPAFVEHQCFWSDEVETDPNESTEEE